MSTIEMVSFRTVAGVSDQQFLQASEIIGEFAKQQDGFEFRALLKKEDGSWQDTVYWKDQASAKNAAQAFSQAENMQDVMALIDPQSTSMEYAQVLAKLAA